jgi:hypothetical protein
MYPLTCSLRYFPGDRRPANVVALHGSKPERKEKYQTMTHEGRENEQVSLLYNLLVFFLLSCFSHTHAHLTPHSPHLTFIALFTKSPFTSL